ncbi:MAG: hypothetical protein JWN39_1233 [Ilumatobacteraceae bacterium]|nr:hypothetical protein [Ilumatobacteraceae bacterium]
MDPFDLTLAGEAGEVARARAEASASGSSWPNELVGMIPDWLAASLEQADRGRSKSGLRADLRWV